MTQVYTVVSEFGDDFAYYVRGNPAMTKLARTLTAEHKKFKVFLCPSEDADCILVQSYYKPVYDHVYIEPVKDNPKFKAVAGDCNNAQMVWHRVMAKSRQIVTPPWLDEKSPEYQHQALMGAAVQEISRLKIRAKEDFRYRTYNKAPDVGTIDSVEQFEERFPREDVDDFGFFETGSQTLISQYGSYQKWWKSGYDIQYFGNTDVHGDDNGFSIFPGKFFEFRRKPPITETDDPADIGLDPTGWIRFRLKPKPIPRGFDGWSPEHEESEDEE
jgi:hypothetical protein